MAYSTLSYLFMSLLILALTPGVSTLMVISRTHLNGLSHGIACIVGITSVDIAYILVALYSYHWVSQLHPFIFISLNLFASFYLFYIAFQMWQCHKVDAIKSSVQQSLWNSFMGGVLVTIADQKVIIFYFGFMPAFFSPEKATFTDSLLIIITAASALMIAKLSYAISALKLKQVSINPRLSLLFKKLAAVIIALAGVMLLIKATQLF